MTSPRFDDNQYMAAIAIYGNALTPEMFEASLNLLESDKKIFLKVITKLASQMVLTDELISAISNAHFKDPSFSIEDDDSSINYMDLFANQIVRLEKNGVPLTSLILERFHDNLSDLISKDNGITENEMEMIAENYHIIINIRVKKLADQIIDESKKHNLQTNLDAVIPVKEIALLVRSYYVSPSPLLATLRSTLKPAFHRSFKIKLPSLPSSVTRFFSRSAGEVTVHMPVEPESKVASSLSVDKLIDVVKAVCTTTKASKLKSSGVEENADQKHESKSPANSSVRK